MYLFHADNEGPVITSPNNVSVNVDSGMADAAVVWSSLPSATDVVEGPISNASIICQNDAGNVVISGGRYPAGTTTVTCRANDTALNEGSIQFTITVIGSFFIFKFCQLRNFWRVDCLDIYSLIHTLCILLFILMLVVHEKLKINTSVWPVNQTAQMTNNVKQYLNTCNDIHLHVLICKYIIAMMFFFYLIQVF